MTAEDHQWREIVFHHWWWVRLAWSILFDLYYRSSYLTTAFHIWHLTTISNLLFTFPCRSWPYMSQFSYWLRQVQEIDIDWPAPHPQDEDSILTTVLSEDGPQSILGRLCPQIFSTTNRDNLSLWMDPRRTWVWPSKISLLSLSPPSALTETSFVGGSPGENSSILSTVIIMTIVSV